MTESSKTAAKKGKPTPKRKDAATRKQSLAPIVSREEKKRSRLENKKLRAASHAAYMRGDESAMPARDRGPARRYVRDFVDSRRSVGEYFMPVIFIVLILTMLPSNKKTADGLPVIPTTQYVAIGIMWTLLAIAVIDGYFLSRRIKKNVAAKFPDASLKGLGMYGWLRSTQMRRMRVPRPQKKAGDKI